MRKKELRTVITFYTTADAMAMEQYCRQQGLPGRLIPVPRALSAGCGLAWSGPLEALEALKTAVRDSGIDAQEICECLA